MGVSAKRVFIASDPFRNADRGKIWHGRGRWPSFWVSVASGEVSGPSTPIMGNGNDSLARPGLVAVYRIRFACERDRTVRIHVTADERYELYLDGLSIGRGPERGDPDHWRYETYDLTLDSGEHVLVVRVWSLGDMAPFAQMSVGHGLLICPDEASDTELLGTGVAPWEAKRLGGYMFVRPDSAVEAGWNLRLAPDARDVDFRSGGGEGWLPVERGDSGINDSVHESMNARTLVPATLPPMLDSIWHGSRVRFAASADAFDMSGRAIRAADSVSAEVEAWQRLIDGTGSLIVPSNSRRRVLIDLTDYVCFYPRFTAAGADSMVRISFLEALFEPAGGGPRSKGNRDEIEGRFFCDTYSGKAAPGNVYYIGDGSAGEYAPLWWQAGRYIEILVQTGSVPLELSSLTIHETRYPLEYESRFSCADERLTQVVPMMVRSMQMCAHETYMDCPYYEQLQYIGDTRLDCLTTYIMMGDDRLPRTALETIAASVLPSGLTQSRYPSRMRSFIPTFALWFVDMLYDYAMWRGDLDFVRRLMPTARGVLDHYHGLMNENGLIAAPRGWTFVDWAPEYDGGVPYGGQDDPVGPIQWQTIYTLELTARLEEILGEPHLAKRLREQSAALVKSTDAAFFDTGRSLYADDLAHTRFSEHAQCLALLSGKVSPDRAEAIAAGLFSATDLIRATVYFAHYLFETCFEHDRTDLLIDRMKMWFDMPGLGLKTTLEQPEPSRSDCHAWGAHPLYHYFATILGIRPLAPGMSSVAITPRLGPLEYASGELVHPSGAIRVSVRRENGGCHIDVDLPEGVTAHIGGRSNITGKASVYRP